MAKTKEIKEEVVKEQENESYGDIPFFQQEHFLTRNLYLNGEISSRNVDVLCKQIIDVNIFDDMSLEEGENPEPMFLHIDSCGGDVIAGFKLIDVIETSRTPIIGITNKAYSMAIPVLLACDNRFSYKHSTFLIHEGYMTCSDSYGKCQDMSKFYDAVSKSISDYIIDKTKISQNTLNSKSREEWYMFSSEALELGIINDIITKEQIK